MGRLALTRKAGERVVLTLPSDSTIEVVIVEVIGGRCKLSMDGLAQCCLGLAPHRVDLLVAFVGDHLNPGECFSYDELADWARENHFVAARPER